MSARDVQLAVEFLDALAVAAITGEPEVARYEPRFAG